jgi:hypothetical protein
MMFLTLHYAQQNGKTVPVTTQPEVLQTALVIQPSVQSCHCIYKLAACSSYQANKTAQMSEYLCCCIGLITNEHSACCNNLFAKLCDLRHSVRATLFCYAIFRKMRISGIPNREHTFCKDAFHLDKK